MPKINIKSKTGFTIIEVVLVLAIAGLIFLMVFIALPTLQSSQRNTQREEDLARILTGVTDYQSNNSGRSPFELTGNGEAASNATITNFVTRYIDSQCTGQNPNFKDDDCGDRFKDPDGTPYNFMPAVYETAGATETVVTSFNDLKTVNHIIYYATGYNCGELEREVVKGTGNRQVALMMMLEGGSVTCDDNQ